MLGRTPDTLITQHNMTPSASGCARVIHRMLARAMRHVLRVPYRDAQARTPDAAVGGVGEERAVRCCRSAPCGKQPINWNRTVHRAAAHRSARDARRGEGC